MAITTLAPYTDAFTGYAPDVTIPRTTSAPFFDAGAVFAPDVTTANQEKGLEVLVDGVLLDGAFERGWEDQINDVGAFSFKMLRADYLAAPIDFDADVTFRLGGVARFLGVVEAIDHVALSSGEGADQVVTISGRGALAEWEQEVVFPSRGTGVLPIEDTRTFSWVGADFDPADNGWPKAKVVNTQSSYSDTGAPRPHIWPDVTGKWIWGNVPGVTATTAPFGFCLFRKTYTLAADKTVRHFFGPDNVGRFWYDGAEATWFAGSANARYIDIEQTAGDHEVAAKVLNSTGPGGFIAVGYTLTAAGLLDEKVYETDATWYCLPYPIRAPGFTDGEFARLLKGEALDTDGVSDWPLTFTDTNATDGKAWNYQREIAVGVGRTYLDVLRERMDAYVEVAVAPGSKALRMWNRGDRGMDRGVTLQQTSDPETSDFLALSHSGKRTRMNYALIRYRDGHTETDSTDPTSISDLDYRVGYLELGAVEGETEAQEIAQAIMELRDRPQFSTTATLFPRSAATTPYLAFEVGDYVTCPNENDDPELMRVVSIACTEDDQGVIEWQVALRDQMLGLEERHDAWLRRMVDGTAVGGARVSSRAGTPEPSATQISVLQVAEFSYPNVALRVLTSPRRPADQSGNVVEVYGQLTTGGTTTTTVEVYKNSTLIATLNFASGVKTVSQTISIVPMLANVDTAQVRVTAAGTGAEGLVVQVRAI